MRFAAVFGIVFMLAPFSLADWPQFRGHNGSGFANGSEPPVRFGPGLNELWRLPLASGHSSPVITGDHIFLTTFDEPNKLLSVVSINRTEGTIRWERPVQAEQIERGHPSFNPASSTPATDGERVVAYFGSVGLVCFDLDGQELWRLPLPLTKSYAGNAISPIIAGESVILYRGNYVDHFLLAVDKHTGKELWKTVQAEPFHPELACTAIPIVHQDLLILHGARSVQGFDLHTGRQRWVTKCATTATSAPLIIGNRAIVAAWNKMGEPALRPEFPTYDDLIDKHDDNQNQVIEKKEFPKLWIFHRPEGAEAPQNGAPIQFRHVDKDHNGEVSREEWERQLRDIERFRQGYQNHGLLSIPIDQSGVLSEGDVITLETQGIPEVPSPVCDGRYIYLVKNGGQITCIDLDSGKRVYRKRTGGSGTHYSSPIIAGGHLYAADGHGKITVMELGPGARVVAVNKLDDGVYSTPAVTNNTLYVRTHSALHAFAKNAE